MFVSRKPAAGARPHGRGPAKPYGSRSRQDDSRSSYGSRGGGGYGEQGGGKFARKRINRFYTVFSEKAEFIDYKDTEKLLKFLTEKGKIIPRRMTGLTAKQQRLLAGAIKRARHSGLIAFQID